MKKVIELREEENNSPNKYSKKDKKVKTDEMGVAVSKYYIDPNGFV
jgi:replicative superfamily II helicase